MMSGDEEKYILFNSHMNVQENADNERRIQLQLQPLQLNSGNSWSRWMFATSELIRQTYFYLPFCAINLFFKKKTTQKPPQVSVKHLTKLRKLMFPSIVSNAIPQNAHKNNGDTASFTKTTKKKTRYRPAEWLILVWLSANTCTTTINDA